MGYIIKATPAQLLTSANEIENNAAEIRQEVEKVREALEPLRQSFLGESAKGFFTEYDQSYEQMQNWDNIVRSFAEEMRTAAMQLRAADGG